MPLLLVNYEVVAVNCGWSPANGLHHAAAEHPKHLHLWDRTHVAFPLNSPGNAERRIFSH